MKSLKFVDNLPSKILAGQKTSTWRIDDEKNIQAGDQLSLSDLSGNEFAQAKVIEVKEAAFSDLSEDDKLGHEQYKNDEEMYQQFAHYYQKPVGPETKVKIIKFELMK
ncbi:ASCH domain-containing protein [Patescibacteria group bacterium]|nr:ASCH domain-containing protein [Patescibacteria group bacterium]